jgi:hypothetical protein
MKVGDEIICVNLKGIGDKVPLTIGKKYKIIYISTDNLIEVISDINEPTYYLKDRFKLLSEVREDKLFELLAE